MIIIEGLLFIILIYLTCYVFYLLLLLIASFSPEKSNDESSENKKLFVILIPAHNEELFIGRLLKSICLQNYPKEYFDTVVVADNCTDNTASIAREYGAVVHERLDLTAMGKGHTLRYGIERINLKQYEAVVVVDADCILHKEVLTTFNKYLQSGFLILQAASAPANASQSWFTRLSDISHAVSNEIILKGKKRLGLSIPLMGTGMCFSADILKQYGWNAFSIGEDWEYYCHLLSDNQKIFFAGEAKVFHEESHNLKQATSQRIRWSSGKFTMACKYGFKLLFMGMKEMNINKVDGSLLLLLPNPSLGINLTLLATICATTCIAIDLPKSFALYFLALFFFQVGFFMLGIFYTKEKTKSFLAIFFAPGFLVWKIAIDLLSAFGTGRKRWVPTKRSLD